MKKNQFTGSQLPECNIDSRYKSTTKLRNFLNSANIWQAQRLWLLRNPPEKILSFLGCDLQPWQKKRVKSKNKINPSFSDLCPPRFATLGRRRRTMSPFVLRQGSFFFFLNFKTRFSAQDLQYPETRLSRDQPTRLWPMERAKNKGQGPINFAPRP